MKRQMIFDDVARHLLTQRRRSLSRHGEDDITTGSAYRGATGARCAIGCLIPDNIYDHMIEGYRVGTYSVLTKIDPRYEVPKKPGHVVADDIEFLERLQVIHDCTPVERWEFALRRFAQMHGLDAAAIDAVSAAGPDKMIDPKEVQPS